MIIRWLMIIIVLALLSIFYLIRLLLKHRPKDSVLIPRPEEQSFKFRLNPNHPLNENIIETLRYINTTGEQIDQNYIDGLANLKSNVKETVAIVLTEYQDQPEERYDIRWSLVYLLKELKHPQTLEAIDAILSSPIPPERCGNATEFSTVDEEVMIRLSAIDALGELWAEEPDKVKPMILKLIQHPIFSLRKAAVLSYLEHSGPNARNELLSMLPEKDHFILNITKADVAKICSISDVPVSSKPEKNQIPTPTFNKRS